MKKLFCLLCASLFLLTACSVARPNEPGSGETAGSSATTQTERATDAATDAVTDAAAEAETKVFSGHLSEPGENAIYGEGGDYVSVDSAFSHATDVVIAKLVESRTYRDHAEYVFEVEDALVGSASAKISVYNKTLDPGQGSYCLPDGSLWNGEVDLVVGETCLLALKHPYLPLQEVDAYYFVHGAVICLTNPSYSRIYDQPANKWSNFDFEHADRETLLTYVRALPRACDPSPQRLAYEDLATLLTQTWVIRVRIEEEADELTDAFRHETTCGCRIMEFLNKGTSTGTLPDFMSGETPSAKMRYINFPYGSVKTGEEYIIALDPRSNYPVIVSRDAVWPASEAGEVLAALGK